MTGNGSTDDPLIPRTLDNELILRQATTDDIDKLVDFNARMQYPTYGISVRDLVSQPNPLVSMEDFLIVVDSAADNKIVSCAALFTYAWQYDGIGIGVGDVEAVATDPDYRRQGLSRAVINAAHTLSAAKGHLVQFVTGKSWYYRQFGYEYTLAGYADLRYRVEDVPPLPTEEEEPYRVRPALVHDLPMLIALHRQQCEGYLVTRARDEATWRFHINDTSVGALAVRFHTILDREGTMIGYYSTWGDHPYGVYIVLELVVSEGVPLYRLLPSLLRHLKARAEREHDSFVDGLLSHFTFSLGQEHPVRRLLHPAQEQDNGFVYYVRVPDIATFLRHIAPALNARLRASPMCGFSGVLSISFYRNSLRLDFAEGQLVTVTERNMTETEEDDHQSATAAFPPLVFLQLLFGYRSLAELRYAFPDCEASREGGLLLNALFPKRPSLLVY